MSSVLVRIFSCSLAALCLLDGSVRCLNGLLDGSCTFVGLLAGRDVRQMCTVQGVHSARRAVGCQGRLAGSSSPCRADRADGFLALLCAQWQQPFGSSTPTGT
ncbi:hypothetical protein BC831DRAFT_249776 [Entophlyctis helioformis]|nr:hypothetical protein BC831DRAFT_249776 [Entophlyctis helioformis]